MYGPVLLSVDSNTGDMWAALHFVHDVSDSQPMEDSVLYIGIEWIFHGNLSLVI